jgi:hypothetical protein
MGSSPADPRQIALPVSRAQSNISNASSLQTNGNRLPSSPPPPPGPPRRVPSDYARAIELQAQTSHNGLRIASETDLPLSRPGSALSMRLNGHTTIPTTTPRISPEPSSRASPARSTPTPLPRQRPGENVAMRRHEIERVLDFRGRKTPTLIKAPRVQWDLTKPFTPSMNTLRSKCSSPLSVVEDQNEEQEEEDRGEDGPYIPSIRGVLHIFRTTKHSKSLPHTLTNNDPASPRSHQRPSSPDPRANIPSPTSNSRHHYIPHRLSDVTEVSSRLSHRSIESTLAPSLVQETRTSRQSVRSMRPQHARPPSRLSQMQARVEDKEDSEEDSEEGEQDEEERDLASPFSNRHSLRTAEVVDVRRLSQSQVRSAEVTISRPSGDRPRHNSNPSLSPRNTEEEDGHNYEQVAKAVRQHMKDQKSIKARLKRAWGRIWRVFHRREAKRKDA